MFVAAPSLHNKNHLSVVLTRCRPENSDFILIHIMRREHDIGTATNLIVYKLKAGPF